ncbi:MAG TPA: LysR family transcriptional regulator [Coleofasciculaceae cyanobacterium]
MNTEWFHCFVETVKSKSLLKTSLNLNISQPAASKQIKKLEQTLGVTLFKRSHSGMELTAAGQELYQRIQPILAELKAIQRDLQTIERPQHIVVGALPSLASYYLPPKVIALKQQGMAIAIQVFHTSQAALEQLQAGNLDVALIQPQPEVNLNQFSWSAELFAEPYCAVLPARHALGRYASLSVTQIRREDMITYPAGCDTRQSLMRVCQHHGFQPKIVTEVAFGESILNFVSAGEGITLLPQSMAEHARHLPVLIRPILDFNEMRTIALVSRLEKVGRSLYRYLVEEPKSELSRSIDN